MTNHLNNTKDSISSGAASIKWNNTSITQEKVRQKKLDTRMENRQQHSRFIQLSSLSLQELVTNWDVYELLRRFVQSQRC